MPLDHHASDITASQLDSLDPRNHPPPTMAWDMQFILAFSASLAIIFLICLPFRLWSLRRSSSRKASSWQGLLKAGMGVSLSITLIAYLFTSAHSEVTFTASMVTSLVASSGLSLLLLLEQDRSAHPSDLATLYLAASIICDFVVLTIPSGRSLRKEISPPILARCVLHLTLMMLECFSERPTATDETISPEEANVCLSMTFFTWINPILVLGYRNILVDQDLPPLSRDMKAEHTRRAMLRAWDQRVKPETKTTLPFALFKCIKVPFVAAIVPRLFLIAFRYSQPILIKNSINFVVSPTFTHENYGYWLIVSAVVVYVGLAISTSIYQHRLNRLRLITRSALVGLIHDKTVNLPGISYDNGESTTLMSTDTDSLVGIAEMFHETWAQLLEVVVGIALLASEVGWIWPLLLFLIFLCSRVSRYVAAHLQSRQKAWNSATQSRVAATSSMLRSMKVIKMLGFQQYLTNRILEFRQEEISAASKLRWMMVYYNSSANALGIFAPAITLAIFAIIAFAQGRSLDVETAFTTVAILGMVTHPANMVMTIVPRAIGTFASFERIQSFLLRPSFVDQRVSLSSNSANNVRVPERLTKGGPSILVRNLTVGDRQPILDGVSFELAAGSLTIISGAVGSGKSTLLRAILGEVTTTHGSIELVTRRIAYCAQRPWLPSGTIKEVIYAHAQADEAWYLEVIDKCCLSHDFGLLPDGDETGIGSRGMNLSGGQRQRVALARALLARCSITLLDDPLSGLDGETEQQVFDNLFGPGGLFRRLKATVMLVTNSTQYFHAVDQIIILGDRKIKEQGTWDEIKTKSSTIPKFIPSVGDRSSVLQANFDKLSVQLQASDEAEADLSRQTGDTALYGYYFRFAGLANILIAVAFPAFHSFFINIPQYWLQIWTESNSNQIFYICGYLIIALVSWMLATGIGWSTLIRLAPNSGVRLHERLLYIVACAPLSYFSETDNGSILNRFSQDIQLVDKQLPTSFSSVCVQICKLIVQTILLFTAQRLLTLSLLICVILVYIIQKVYLRTSRQLRFLELESRAAVFSSFLESIEGLEAIRSFGWRREIVQENILRVEDSQRPEFLLLSLQRWLNIVLDLLTAAIASSVVALAVLFRDRISGGQVGVALNIMLVANTTLLRLVENWTQLEISLGAVSRLKTLERTTPSEGNDKELEPPENWPSEGKVKITNANASYGSDVSALLDIDLDIDQGQKVIICGRTGSGKSSLVLVLLRILELQAGKVEVDGIDISRVRLDLVRQRCFITVSQDALILANETLRFNLDPQGSLSDDSLIDALERTGLWHHFMGSKLDESNNDAHPILDTKISFLQELSVGQCQLFAMCRAIIKANTMRSIGVKPITLLDEVTSSLDHATESIIHGIIEKEFTSKGHTVIMITHRLGVIAECTRPGRDMVVLMEDGRIHELITDLTPDPLRRIGIKD